MKWLVLSLYKIDHNIYKIDKNTPVILRKLGQIFKKLLELPSTSDTIAQHKKVEYEREFP